MKKNMGTADRTIRTILALVAFGLYFAKVITGVWAIVAVVAAFVFLITSLVSFCPLYMPFGVSTGKNK
jgi:hypothetical protein